MAPKRSKRDPGRPWRLLAHTDGADRDIRDNGSDFDELVVGKWIHIERMNDRIWWMDIGGVTVHVKADRDGKPVEVTVHGPLDYNAPVEGCRYKLTWTDLPDDPEVKR
jgi:hypothetical protein